MGPAPSRGALQPSWMWFPSGKPSPYPLEHKLQQLQDEVQLRVGSFPGAPQLPAAQIQRDNAKLQPAGSWPWLQTGTKSPFGQSGFIYHMFLPDTVCFMRGRICIRSTLGSSRWARTAGRERLCPSGSSPGSAAPHPAQGWLLLQPGTQFPVQI